MHGCVDAGVATGKLQDNTVGVLQVLITAANPNSNTHPNPTLTNPTYLLDRTFSHALVFRILPVATPAYTHPCTPAF